MVPGEILPQEENSPHLVPPTSAGILLFPGGTSRSNKGSPGKVVDAKWGGLFLRVHVPLRVTGYAEVPPCSPRPPGRPRAGRSPVPGSLCRSDPSQLAQSWALTKNLGSRPLRLIKVPKGFTSCSLPASQLRAGPGGSLWTCPGHGGRASVPTGRRAGSASWPLGDFPAVP